MKRALIQEINRPTPVCFTCFSSEAERGRPDRAHIGERHQDEHHDDCAVEGAVEEHTARADGR